MEKNSWFTARYCINQLNIKLKVRGVGGGGGGVGGVKHSWFYFNHENHEDISPRKFPAIQYYRISVIARIVDRERI